DVALVGSANLAAYAEAELHGAPVADALIAQELAPCFIDEGGRRTDTVVLACTHYPLLVDRMTSLAPWPVTFIDPAPAIARRARRGRRIALPRTDRCHVGHPAVGDAGGGLGTLRNWRLRILFENRFPPFRDLR